MIIAPTEFDDGVFGIGGSTGRMYPDPTESIGGAFEIDCATGEHVGSLLWCWPPVRQTGRQIPACLSVVLRKLFAFPSALWYYKFKSIVRGQIYDLLSK